MYSPISEVFLLSVQEVMTRFIEKLFYVYQVKTSWTYSTMKISWTAFMLMFLHHFESMFDLVNYFEFVGTFRKLFRVKMCGEKC